jgi:hypothetical protein
MVLSDTDCGKNAQCTVDMFSTEKLLSLTLKKIYLPIFTLFTSDNKQFEISMQLLLCIINACKHCGCAKARALCTHTLFSVLLQDKAQAI